MNQDAYRIIQQATSESRERLDEMEALSFCNSFHIPTAKTLLASDVDDVVRCADRIGYPVVLKVVSPQINHKSDSGGVRIGIRNASEALSAVMSMKASISEKANVNGILVQEMLTGGTELIVGLNLDPQFGPVVMFGLGGVFVETLNDVSMRLPPLEIEDSLEMIHEIKGYPLLNGVRGKKPVNIDSIVQVLQSVSALAVDTDGKISSMDLNPVISTEDGCKAVDARVILSNGIK